MALTSDTHGWHFGVSLMGDTDGPSQADAGPERMWAMGRATEYRKRLRVTRADLRSRRAQGQGGQAAVLTAIGLFTMVLFLALAVNTGTLVNDRIRFQNTADLTAYSGAYQQAASLNSMASINSDIYKTVQRLRAALNYGPAYAAQDNPDNAPVFYWNQPACSCLDYSQDAEDMIEFYQRRLDALYDRMEVINSTANTQVKQAATNTAKANLLYDLNGNAQTGSDHLSFFGKLTGKLVGLSRVETTMVGYNFLRSCRCCDGCCLYPQQHVEAINSWGYKTDTGKVYIPVKVRGVPLKNFLDITSNIPYFGADSTDIQGDNDRLYGYSAAKPFEGNVGTSNPDNLNEGGSFIPQNPIYPPSDDLETGDGSVDYFRPSYRARLMGVHENVGASTSPASMADLIRTDAQDPQFQDKTDYFTH